MFSQQIKLRGHIIDSLLLPKVLDEIQTIEPLLRRGATHEINTSIPLDRAVARVLEIALG